MSNSKLSKQTANRLERCVEHLTQLRYNAYRILSNKLGVNGKIRNTKTGLKYIGFRVVEWILLGQNREQWLCIRHDNGTLDSTKG
jgi:hypothetical protein